MNEASNPRRPRRNEEMKFAYAGPFVRLLDPIRPVKPVRDFIGRIYDPQPRYTPRSAESWTIQSAIDQPGRGALPQWLEQKFGREYGSTLDDEPVARPKRRGRRGGRGRGRKPVTK